MEEDDADDDDDSAASNPRFFEEHGSGGAASPPAHKSIAQLASDIDPGKLTAIELSGLLKVIGVQHDGGATKEELTAALSEVTGVSYDEDADDSAAAAAAAAGKTEKERHGALDRARVWSAPDPQTAATAAAAAQRDPDGYKYANFVDAASTVMSPAERTPMLWRTDPTLYLFKLTSPLLHCDTATTTVPCPFEVGVGMSVGIAIVHTYCQRKIGER